MERIRTSTGRRFLLTALALLLLPGLTLGQAQNEQSTQNLYIVNLKGRSVLEEAFARLKTESRADVRAFAQTSALREYKRALEEDQDRFVSRIESSNRRLRSRRSSLQVIDRRSYLLNCVFVRASEDDLPEIASDPDVLRIVESLPRYPLLDGAAEQVRADVLWNALGGPAEAGRGVKIGIVDSGINVDHPMFLDAGLVTPPGYPKLSSPEDASFANNKVIVARSYHELFPNPQANQTPGDELGHGSRVASIAAGNRVDAPLATIQGIAPMSFLGNYKVFGTPGINPTASSASIVAALSDAVADGMDVINLSFGGPAANPATDPEQQAISAAVKAGVVVVVSAGNSGPDPGTITSPGTSPDAITVGAVTNWRTFGSGLEIIAEIEVPTEIELISYTPGEGVEFSDPIGPLPIRTVKDQDSTELACQPLQPDSLVGAVALVRRGTCLFQTKADNVFAAGAEAMVVYNNVDGGTVVMSFQETGPSLPSVMINLSQGEQLRDFLFSTPVQVETILRSTEEVGRFLESGDVVTGFSSRGPSIDHSIKPDLSAVGDKIYSASRDSSEFTTNSSGTSFSAPQVAGGAALLLQLNSDWTPDIIKSVLVSTADKSPTWNGQPARIIQTGNGRLDLSGVLEADLAFSPVSVSFGIQEDYSSADSSTVKSLRLENLTTAPLELNIEYVPVYENASIQVHVEPRNLNLAGLWSEEVFVTVSYAPSLTGGTFEGYLRVVDLNDGSAVTASVWGGLTVADPDRVLTVSQGLSGEFESLEEAIQAARPGNTIEIVDSATYNIQSRIEYSDAGLPLHGLTIRSGKGQTPILDGSNLAASSAVLTFENLDRITVEGLRIQGGLRGIRFFNTSGVIRQNVILADSASSSGFGISLTNARAHVLENEILRSGGTAISAFSSTALIQGNRVKEFPSDNRGNGIFAASGATVAIFDNSISGAGNLGSGQGVRLSNASGLMRGNRIIDTQGELADGVLVRGSLGYLEAYDNEILDSRRAGVSVFPGATAELFRSRISGNASAGIFAEEGSNVAVDGLELFYNGFGILNFGSNVAVRNSVIAFSESSGIESQSGSLLVTGATVSENGAQGILADSALLTNSIIANNLLGDLYGLEIESVHNNLVGDGWFDGENGNFSGDPLFSAPEALDFSPSAQSRAIDTGDNDRVSSDFELDLNGHARVVDGNLDGTARVDVGAVESNSPYAYPFLLPVLSEQAGDFIGLAATNSSKSPGADSVFRTSALVDEDLPASKMHLQRFTANGTPAQESEISVSFESQDSKLLTELLGKPLEGWIQLSPTSPLLSGFTLLGDYRLEKLDGVPLGRATDSIIIFPQIKNSSSESTTLFVVNPSDTSTVIEFTWIRSGSDPSRTTRTLPARGLLKARVDILFGPGEGGYILARNTSSRPIYGVEIFGSDQSIGVLEALGDSAAADDLYGAQFVSLSNLETELTLINLGEPQEVIIDVFGDEGDILSSVTVELEQGGLFQKRASEFLNLPEAGIVGWVRVLSATARLIGSLRFDSADLNQISSLPLQAAGAREFVFGHVAQTADIFTGITLLNIQPETTPVSIEVFDFQGNRTGLALTELGRKEKKALLLTEWVPSLESQAGGFIRIRSTLPLFGFELFGSSSYLSAVPQQVVIP